MYNKLTLFKIVLFMLPHLCHLVLTMTLEDYALRSVLNSIGTFIARVYFYVLVLVTNSEAVCSVEFVEANLESTCNKH